MNTEQDQLQALRDIRNIMDRSSRFLSLSGLSGVFAGLAALCGAALVRWYFTQRAAYGEGTMHLTPQDITFLACTAAAVLIAALVLAVYFTVANARRKQLPVWDKQSQRLVINLAIPLAAGGAFCALLLHHHALQLIIPAMLMFYGLTLINGSKYTLGDIRYLGLCELALGIMAGLLPGYPLVWWTIGFGLLHVLYGTIMYFKYEREG